MLKNISKSKKEFDDGSIYEGDLADGIPHGKGKLTDYNRHGGIEWIYEGDFIEGKQTGKGKKTIRNNVYEGDFFEGKEHGKGKYTDCLGGVYEGDFVNGSKTGKGKESHPNGAFYEGDFVKGHPHGIGKYTHANGKADEGYWFENIFMGSGPEGKSKFDEKSKPMTAEEQEAYWRYMELRDRICP